jgi:hypothetical protein
MTDTIVLWIVVLTLVGVSSYLIGMLVKSILQERRSSRVQRIWKNFALSITFAALFLLSWVVQGFAEWGVYRDEQRAHGEPIVVSEYIVQFGQSTLENWQSEFLQLFSFVVLSAVLIHRGSAESKDGTDRIENTVNEIRQMLVEQNGGSRTKTSAKT